jgi:hypothetical protein
MPSRAIAITGLKEIDRALGRLGPAVQRRVIRKAMRAGLKVLATAVKAEVPVDTGRTSSEVKVRAVKSRRRGSIQLEVRIEATDELRRTGAKTGKTVFYPAIVEYKGDDFMARAFASRGEAARRVTLDRLRAGVEEEARR